MVERAPMVAQLIRAFGLDLETAIAPAPEIVRDLAGRNYGVFYVAEARNSPYIPDQEFVASAKLRSVVGFGGALANGDLFATILFSRVAITERAADRFRTLALDLKRRFFLYSPEQVFDDPA
jgi:uncharacterized protein (DUF697 family)